MVSTFIFSIKQTRTFLGLSGNLAAHSEKCFESLYSVMKQNVFSLLSSSTSSQSMILPSSITSEFFRSSSTLDSDEYLEISDSWEQVDILILNRVATKIHRRFLGEGWYGIHDFLATFGVNNTWLPPGTTRIKNWYHPKFQLILATFSLVIPKVFSDKSESGGKWILFYHWLISSIWRILNQWKKQDLFSLTLWFIWAQFWNQWTKYS